MPSFSVGVSAFRSASRRASKESELLYHVHCCGGSIEQAAEGGEGDGGSGGPECIRKIHLLHETRGAYVIAW